MDYLPQNLLMVIFIKTIVRNSMKCCFTNNTF